MGLKSKKIKNWIISYLNESELDEMINELYGKNYYQFHTTKPDPVIFDVGALIGETILYFKDLYPRAKVTAFEPSPRSFKLLKRNMQQNHISNVKLINAAVSNKKGKIDFYIDRDETNPWGRGDSLKTTRFANPQISKVVKVPAVQLSRYIASNIDLLKIDIEGAETEVLKEVEPKLKYVKEIILEFHSSVYNPENNYSQVMNILRRNGFQIKQYFSRWQIPVFAASLIFFLQSTFGVNELWLRIYARAPQQQP